MSTAELRTVSNTHLKQLSKNQSGNLGERSPGDNMQIYANYRVVESKLSKSTQGRVAKLPKRQPAFLVNTSGQGQILSGASQQRQKIPRRPNNTGHPKQSIKNNTEYADQQRQKEVERRKDLTDSMALESKQRRELWVNSVSQSPELLREYVEASADASHRKFTFRNDSPNPNIYVRSYLGPEAKQEQLEALNSGARTSLLCQAPFNKDDKKYRLRPADKLSQMHGSGVGMRYKPSDSMARIQEAIKSQRRHEPDPFDLNLFQNPVYKDVDKDQWRSRNGFQVTKTAETVWAPRPLGNEPGKDPYEAGNEELGMKCFNRPRQVHKETSRMPFIASGNPLPKGSLPEFESQSLRQRSSLERQMTTLKWLKEQGLDKRGNEWSKEAPRERNVQSQLKIFTQSSFGNDRQDTQLTQNSASAMNYGDQRKKGKKSEAFMKILQTHESTDAMDSLFQSRNGTQEVSKERLPLDQPSVISAGSMATSNDREDGTVQIQSRMNVKQDMFTVKEAKTTAEDEIPGPYHLSFKAPSRAKAPTYMLDASAKKIKMQTQADWSGRASHRGQNLMLHQNFARKSTSNILSIENQEADLDDTVSANVVEIYDLWKKNPQLKLEQSHLDVDRNHNPNQRFTKLVQREINENTLQRHLVMPKSYHKSLEPYLIKPKAKQQKSVMRSIVAAGSKQLTSLCLADAQKSISSEAPHNRFKAVSKNKNKSHMKLSAQAASVQNQSRSLDRTLHQTIDVKIQSSQASLPGMGAYENQQEKHKKVLDKKVLHSVLQLSMEEPARHTNDIRERNRTIECGQFDLSEESHSPQQTIVEMSRTHRILNPNSSQQYYIDEATSNGSQARFRGQGIESDFKRRHQNTAGLTTPAAFHIAPNQIYGSPHSTSRQLRMQLTQIYHAELEAESTKGTQSHSTATFDYRAALDSRKSIKKVPILPNLNHQLSLKSKEFNQTIEQKFKEVVAGHANIERHSSITLADKLRSGSAQSPSRNKSNSPGYASMVKFSSSEIQELSLEQKHLVDVIKRLQDPSMSKNGSQQQLMSATASTRLMQIAKVTPHKSSQAATDATAEARLEQRGGRTSTMEAATSKPRSLTSSLVYSHGVPKLDPTFRKSQVRKMVDHYFDSTSV